MIFPKPYNCKSDNNTTETIIEISQEHAEWIRRYLDTPNKICPRCGLNNFGRNQECADWRCRNEFT